MKKLAQLEKTIPLIGNMFLPAFLFAVALLSFYLCGDYSSGTTGFLHIGFYLLNFVGFLALLYFNRAKPVLECRHLFALIGTYRAEIKCLFHNLSGV